MSESDGVGGMSTFAETAAKLKKPRPKLLTKRDAARERDATDRRENLTVKSRSGGRCEVLTIVAFVTALGRDRDVIGRCPLRASHIHHLISGIGRRNVGASIEAAHKLHVCDRCHAEIHGHVLVPVNQTERESAATVRYERVR